MIRRLNFTQDDTDFLENLYMQTIQIAVTIYGDLVFRPFNPEEDTWARAPQKAFYDAVMVGLSNYLDRTNDLIAKREGVIEGTKAFFKSEKIANDELIWRTGSKKAVKARMSEFSQMLDRVLSD